MLAMRSFAMTDEVAAALREIAPLLRGAIEQSARTAASYEQDIAVRRAYAEGLSKGISPIPRFDQNKHEERMVEIRADQHQFQADQRAFFSSLIAEFKRQNELLAKIAE